MLKAFTKPEKNLPSILGKYEYAVADFLKAAVYSLKNHLQTFLTEATLLYIYILLHLNNHHGITQLLQVVQDVATVLRLLASYKQSTMESIIMLAASPSRYTKNLTDVYKNTHKLTAPLLIRKKHY